MDDGVDLAGAVHACSAALTLGAQQPQTYRRGRLLRLPPGRSATAARRAGAGLAQ